MDAQQFFKSKSVKLVLTILAGLIVLLFVFRAGMFVGFKKAGFSFRWGENYHQNFGGPRQGFFNEFMGDDFISAFGAAGQIIKISGSTIVVKDRDNTEKSVIIKETTSIMSGRDKIDTSKLRVDDIVVVIGDPNDKGQIEAKLIRVMPAVPPMMSSPIMSPRFR